MQRDPPDPNEPEDLEDIRFPKNNTNFKNGFNEFKKREFTGRCMIRASKQCIALEICASEGSDGEELCREYFNNKRLHEIESTVKRYVRHFLRIVGERNLVNFVVAFTDVLKTDFTFKFLYNENALIKYHWDVMCRLIHVEIPKNYTRSPNRHHIAFVVRRQSVEVPSLRFLFNDADVRGGRKIYAYNPGDHVRNRISYCTLHDDSPSLLYLVVDRFDGRATECLRRNDQRRFSTVSMPSTYFGVPTNEKFALTLHYLKHCSFSDGHLVIYTEDTLFALECRHDRFTAPHRIFNFRRQQGNRFPGYIVDGKRKMDAVLKLIWERKFLKYTIVFGEHPSPFSIILRYEHGGEFHTQMRHHWDIPNMLNFLTVIHSGRSDDATLLREINIHVRREPLEPRLFQFHLFKQESEPPTAVSRKPRPPEKCTEWYSTEANARVSSEMPTILAITKATVRGGTSSRR